MGLDAQCKSQSWASWSRGEAVRCWTEFGDVELILWGGFILLFNRMIHLNQRHITTNVEVFCVLTSPSLLFFLLFPQRSPEFNDFLRRALDKNPETRPSAVQLLEVGAAARRWKRQGLRSVAALWYMMERGSLSSCWNVIFYFKSWMEGCVPGQRLLPHRGHDHQSESKVGRCGGNRGGVWRNNKAIKIRKALSHQVF